MSNHDKPLAREAKNHAVISGAVDEFFQSALAERQPDALRAMTIALVHRVVDDTLKLAAAPVAAEVPASPLSSAQVLQIVRDVLAQHSEGAARLKAAVEAGARAALAAQPAAEPVAWRYRVPAAGGGSAWTFTRPQPELLLETQPLYASAPAAGQAAPAQAQALTREQLEALWASMGIGGNLAFDIARAVERAHGIPAPTGAAPTGAAE